MGSGSASARHLSQNCRPSTLPRYSATVHPNISTIATVARNSTENNGDDGLHNDEFDNVADDIGKGDNDSFDGNGGSTQLIAHLDEYWRSASSVTQARDKG